MPTSKFRADERCPHCRIRYQDFRTGFTYKEVFELLKTDESEDKEEWTYKRRKRVLYHWCSIKQEFWEYHTELGGCPKDPRNTVKPDIDDFDNVPF